METGGPQSCIATHPVHAITVLPVSNSSNFLNGGIYICKSIDDQILAVFLFCISPALCTFSSVLLGLVAIRSTHIDALKARKHLHVYACAPVRKGPREDWEEKEVQCYDSKESTRPSLADKYEYVMYGKLYKISEEGSGANVKVEIYASFGGLLMLLKGDPSNAANLELDQRLFILLRKQNTCVRVSLNRNANVCEDEICGDKWKDCKELEQLYKSADSLAQFSQSKMPCWQASTLHVLKGASL
eukprot:Gb_21181 [translate_table: standard]